MNLNALFDHRLGGTDLMITEHNSMVNEQVSLNSVFRTVSDSRNCAISSPIARTGSSRGTQR